MRCHHIPAPHGHGHGRMPIARIPAAIHAIPAVRPVPGPPPLLVRGQSDDQSVGYAGKGGGSVQVGDCGLRVCPPGVAHPCDGGVAVRRSAELELPHLAVLRSGRRRGG